MIGPGQLLTWVGNTCPWLIAALPQNLPRTRLAAVATGSEGYRQVLAAGTHLMGAKPTTATREDYLLLCLAAHHATVGSYVPTDVDSKIRGELWRRANGETLRRRWEAACLARGWSPLGVSTRVELTGDGPISGHDGEWLGVAVAALGAARLANDPVVADEALAWIRAELTREARAFAAACSTASTASASELVALARLAWILTHNVGDVDQGLSYWPEDPRLAGLRQELAELAHERPERHGGAFPRAKAIYQIVAPEGHRHYPLRDPRCLRRGPELLLPLGPCFERWGRTVAGSPLLNDAERAEVLAALLAGVHKVRNQVGYQRALAGLATVPGGLAGLAKLLPPQATDGLGSLAIQNHVVLSEEKFAAQLAERIAAVVTTTA